MKLFISFWTVYLILSSSLTYGNWNFRGDPNQWGSTPMDSLSETHWRTFQNFSVDEKEFKIAHDDGWSESYPENNFIVTEDQKYLIEFYVDSKSIVATPLHNNVWMFRGTSNNWEQTPLEFLGDGLYRICRDFQDGDGHEGPRFKISRDGWQESYPETDFLVSNQSSIEITFNENNKIVTAEEVSHCKDNNSKWNFRGTTNHWDKSPMIEVEPHLFEICQSFTDGGVLGQPRFKIANKELGWSMAFPENDFIVQENQHLLIHFNEMTQEITTSLQDSCLTSNNFQITSQLPRVTIKDVPFQLANQLVTINRSTGFNLIVSSGNNYTVENQVITPNPGFIGTLNIPIHAESNGEISDPFVFNLEVIDLMPNRSLIIHEDGILNTPNKDLSLVRFFNHLAEQSQDMGITGVDLFQQFWDTQNTSTGISTGPHCGDEVLSDGLTPSLNGYPIVCDRQEGQKVQTDDESILAEMQSYFPIAAINRMDLQRSDFSDCGEHRMIFARGNSNGAGRNFIIAEARVPNPDPGNAQGCLPLINFWLSLTTKDHSEIHSDLSKAFYQGIENFPAIFSFEHFTTNQGQIRTNQFITPIWMLREYKLEQICDIENCRLTALPVTVKENPFGPLFDGTIPSSNSEFANRASEFQQDFLENINSLVQNNVGSLTINTQNRFNNGQSHASGHTSENNYNLHFDNGLGSEFFNQLTNSLDNQTDARGNPLTTTQVLNRATALTCGGCHQPSSFGLTAQNAIGAMTLPNGDIIDSWPRSRGFVHVSEFSVNGEFGLSPALENVFIPMRENFLMEYLLQISE